jgi:hypothetical protein
MDKATAIAFARRFAEEVAKELSDSDLRIQTYAQLISSWDYGSQSRPPESGQTTVKSEQWRTQGNRRCGDNSIGEFELGETAQGNGGHFNLFIEIGHCDISQKLPDAPFFIWGKAVEG